MLKPFNKALLSIALVILAGAFAIKCTRASEVYKDTKERRYGSLAVSVDVNGTSHTIPETGEEGWGTNVTSWIQAISANTIHPNGGSFPLTNDIDFGSGSGIVAPYLKGLGTLPSEGLVRLSSSSELVWRDFEDSADLGLGVSQDGQKKLVFNSENVVTETKTQTIQNKSIQSSTVSGSLLFTNNGDAAFREASANGVNQISVKAPSVLDADYEFILPNGEGASGEYLTTDGNGNTSWAAVSGGGSSTKNYAIVSSATALTASDDVVGVATGGSAYTITLPPRSANIGKVLVIHKLTNDFVTVTIDGDGSDTINAASSVKLNTEGESYELVATSVNWRIINHDIPSAWTDYTPGGNWSAVATNEAAWRRVGDSIMIKFSLDLTGTPTSNFSIDLPSGLTFDTANLLQEYNFTAVPRGALGMLTGGAAYDGILGYGTTTSFIGKVVEVGGTYARLFNVSPSAPSTWTAGDHMFGQSVPMNITDWELE